MAAKEKFYNIEFLHVEVPAVTWFKKLSASKNPEERAFLSQRGGIMRLFPKSLIAYSWQKGV